jgi:hypothetical protein
LGVGTGAFLEGTKIPSADLPKGATLPKYYGRRMARGGALGLGAGLAADIGVRFFKHHMVGSDNE